MTDPIPPVPIRAVVMTETIRISAAPVGREPVC